MTHIRNLLKRSSYLTGAFLLIAMLLAADTALFTHHANAAQITARKLTVASSASGSTAVGAAATGTNGAQTKHTFDFTTSGASVGSIEFLYCTTPLPGTTCTAPTGMDASTVTSVAGTSASGWTSSATTSRLRITHTAGVVTTANFIFGNGGSTNYIKNPTVAGTYFVRITTFSDTAWTTPVDQGTVANSVAQQISVTAKVQETLNFSVGAPINADGSGSIPSPTGCTAFSDDGELALGDVTDGTLSFTTAYDAHSYFRVSTNANGGTVVYYSGDTLKNPAGNSITAIGASAAASAIGTSQFGLAIDSGDATVNGYSFTNLTATAPYNAGNGLLSSPGTTFAFNTASVTAPVAIASASGPILCDTGSVRYLGNISTTTPPGVYTTKISYIATPTY
jgi:hypothetical protein